MLGEEKSVHVGIRGRYGDAGRRRGQNEKHDGKVGDIHI